MNKEKIPKFFSFDIVNIIITIISFIALFSFWGNLKDEERILFIVLPIIFIFLLVNLIRYYLSVKEFYKKYENLYERYQALIQNYKENMFELKQERYNNDVLRDFANRTLTVLITYNDMTKEERKTIKADIISNFISGSQKGGDDNE